MVNPKKDNPLTFFDHLEELRFRIIRSVVVVLVATCLIFVYANSITAFLIRPVGRVIFTAPGEAFGTVMLLSLISGVILSMPYILLECWFFIASALTDSERKYIGIFAPLSLLLFVLGCAFGYFALLPVMMKFFLSFSSPEIEPMIAIGKYIAFVGNLVLSCGIIFEMPLAIAFLAKIGIASPAFLIDKRKYAILIIFVVSAVLTPSPDCFSQVLMAVPLMILYEISIVLSRWIYGSTRPAKGGACSPLV